MSASFLRIEGFEGSHRLHNQTRSLLDMRHYKERVHERERERENRRQSETGKTRDLFSTEKIESSDAPQLGK